MKKIIVTLMVLVSSVVAIEASELDVIRKRYCDMEMSLPHPGEGNAPDADKNIEKIIKNLSADGSWKDIDYTTKDNSLWKPAIKHFGNLNTLVRKWYVSRDSKLEEPIHRAFGFWLRNKFKNPNWWWNEIGVPMSVGRTSLMFYDVLTDEERREAIEIMKAAEFRMTGQNRIWLAKVNLMRAIISNDRPRAEKACAIFAEEVRISNREGIRPDWCFHQHGRQPQFGNYGLSFVVNTSQFIHLFAGTSFAFPKEKVDIFKNLLDQGYAWVIWKGYMDVPSLCRQLFPEAARKKAASIEHAKKTLEKCGVKLNPNPPTGFKYFDCSAMGYYRTATWMASVKMSTTDIIGVETWINNDNILGGHMADGALYTMVTGKEYADVFPLWNNWRLIPGITTYMNFAPIKKNKPQGPKHFYEYGANWSNNVGGKKTENGGIVTMELKREGLIAQKKWEFTPTSIICTGEGISATNPKGDVITCVEHAHAVGDVKIFKAPDGTTRALNGKIGYVIDAPADEVHAAVEERSGAFNTFMKTVPHKTITGKVFVAYIKHGKMPSNAKYRYWILPDTTEDLLRAFSTKNKQ